MRKLCLMTVCAAAVLSLTDLARATPLGTVAAGTDYFQTEAGTQFDFGPPNGTVSFLGVPFGPGATDTIVQRLTDAIIGGPSISLQMTGLQLRSTTSVTFGAYTGPAYVSLDPTQLANDLGTMSIAGTTAGGTFSSSLNVFFDVCTAIGVNGVGCGSGMLITTNNVTLSNSGAVWSPTPPGDAVIVPGAYPNVAANLHSGLPTDYVDFFPVLIDEQHGPGAHIVDPALPEPASMLLLGTGLLGLAGLRNRKRR